MDNTLIFYITGDNGSVFQGGPIGAFNELSVFNAQPEPLDIALKNLDKFGGPESHILYPNGWAFAGATPFAGPTRWPPTEAFASPLWSIGRKASRSRAACARSVRRD